MKKSFVLYIDNYEPIKLLTLVQKGQLLDYMFMYNLGIEFTIEDPVLKMAFSFFEQTFIRDNKKWLDIAERNKRNGSKGGRPIKNENNHLDNNPENPDEPSGLLNNPENPDEPSGLLNNPENPDEPRKAVSVSVSVIGSAIGKRKDLLSDSPESDQKENSKQFKKPLIEEIAQYCRERKNRVDPEKFFNFYESKGWMIGKNKMKNWRSAIITWEKGDNGKQNESKGQPRIFEHGTGYYGEGDINKPNPIF